MSEDSTKRNRQSLGKEILYVWDYLEWGGAQIYFFSLMRAAQRKWSVRAVLPEKSAARMFDDLKKNGIEAITVPAHTDASPAPGLKRKLERHWNKASSELILLRYLKPLNLSDKILHLELAPWHSFSAIFYLARKSHGIVQTIHTPLPAVSAARFYLWKTKLRILSLLKNYRLLVSNQVAKESLKQFVSAAVFEKIEIAYSGINTDEIDLIFQNKPSRAEIASKYDLPLENLWVFCLGQFIERKGCWILLEAAQKVKREGENVTFVWIATNEPDAETRSKIDGYELGETFRLLIPNDFGGARADLLTLVSHADIFVLASYQEGLPIALCEAMALEKACVSTNVGAIPEAIKDRETGLLIEAGDARMLTKAILELKNDAVLRNGIANAGRKLVLEKFDEKKSAQTTLKVYEELWQLK